MSVAIRRLGSAALFSTLLVGACSDGPTATGAERGAARLSVVASFAGSADSAGGGPAEAFDRADRLFLRVLAGDDVRLEVNLPFDAAAGETIVPIDVPLRDAAETFLIDLELRVGTQPVFSGSASADLRIGVSTDVAITLLPVVAGVVCSGPVIELAAYGATATLPGFATFATGDTIPEVPIQWSSANAAIASISQAGTVTALQDGAVAVTCQAGGFTDTRTVNVFAVVTSVEVAPAEATVHVGANTAFGATLRDALGSVITAPRPLAWSSGDATVATIDEAGVATGVRPGTVTITATSGAATGTAVLTVIFPPPTVSTEPATGITSSDAVLHGLVNPNGVPTEAWFEWGTSPTLATPQATPLQQLGGGSTALAVSASLANLLLDQTYFFRVVARGEGGLVHGQILSFTTLRPPTVVTTGVTLVVQGQELFADMAASINAHGTPTRAGFEWDTSPSFVESELSELEGVGSATVAVPFGQRVGPIQTLSTYFVRAWAESEGGTTFGNVITVVTPRGAVEVMTEDHWWDDEFSGDTRIWTANMWGLVMPNGAPATAWIEYSTDRAFETFSSSAPVQIPASLVFEPFNTQLTIPTGLQDPMPELFYRVAASNAFGTVRSAVVQVGEGDG